MAFDVKRGRWKLRLCGALWILVTAALAPFAICQNPESMRLVGAGTSLPLPVYSKWFQEFERTRPDLHFIYIPSGSDIGIEMMTTNQADFGATDAPLTGEIQAKAKVSQVATLLVALVPVYNVAGVSRPLKFTPQVLAGIYLGTITKWNDRAIAAVNPGVQLPANEIVVVHSASGRGSTYVWSDYLSKVSPEWRAKVGRGIDVEWPVGREAQGNGNVAKMVKATPNAIGYVEMMYAERSSLAMGEVQNAAGNYVAADLASVKEAALAAKPNASEFRASITNASGENAYPIASFTWLLISESATSNSKREALKAFLCWALKQGQGYVEPAGFTRLPAAIAEQELKSLEKVSVAPSAQKLQKEIAHPEARD